MGPLKNVNFTDLFWAGTLGLIQVVFTSAFLIFFLAFLYRGVYFKWHSRCTPLVVLREQRIEKNPLVETTHHGWFCLGLIRLQICKDKFVSLAKLKTGP